MSFRKFIIEQFSTNFDSAKSSRSQEDWKYFISYEEKLFRLKKLAFEAGYELSVRWTGNSNPKNGYFDIMEPMNTSDDPTKPIKSFEDFNLARTWLLSNYKNK